MRLRMTRLVCLVIVLLAAGFVGPSALADPLYTVTDLGPGPITLNTTNGGIMTVPNDGIGAFSYATSALMSVSNGQASYAFQTTPDTKLAASALAALPGPTETGFVLGLNGTYTSALVNPKGSLVAIFTGYQGDQEASDIAYSVQRNGDGTWGVPKLIVAGPNTVYEAGNSGSPNEIWVSGLNSGNQALLGTTHPGYDALIYNTTTGSLTDLYTLASLQGSPYSNFVPLAIDDQGRILLKALVLAEGHMDTLLLTPSGVSSDPIPLSTPEPGTLAIWCFHSGACAGLRTVARRLAAKFIHVQYRTQ